MSIFLKSLTKELFNDIRRGMNTLTLEDVKEILIYVFIALEVFKIYER